VVARTLGQVSGPILAILHSGIDHFVWDPIPSPQRILQPIPVQVSARDVLDRVVTNFNANVSLSALTDPKDVVLFSESFENGDLAGWDRDANYGDWSVVSNTAAGRSSVSLIGGRGQHRDGISHALPDLKPDIVKFSVRASRLDRWGAYVVLGTGPDLEELALYFLMRPDGMGVIDASSVGHGVPFQVGQWYEVELHLSWTQRTLDYYVDGISARAGHSLPQCRRSFFIPDLPLQP